jgi:FAD synthetase
LYLAQLHTYFTSSASTSSDSPSKSSTFPPSVPSIYAKPPDPFPAVTSFVSTSSTAYHLSLTHITTSPPATSSPDPTSKRITFRDAFEIYLTSNPEIKAIFVGTRRTDPHGKYLTHFDRTDKGWPDFMRIHPVIDWHLSEIWCFLRAKELGEADGSHLAYCSMYDEGYTSLGGVNDTSKNPKLKDNGGYRPAYELTKDSEERLGR